MKSENCDSLWQRIHIRAKEKNIPLRVMFELTYRCNFKCKHCYIPHSYREKYAAKELKTKEIFGIIDQLKDIGCFFLGFTGGEPFMRKDALEIFKYAKSKGFQVIIYSNGSLINDKIGKELGRLNINKVDITIPGIKQATFDSITGFIGAHKRVFKAIDSLRKHQVPLGFKSCILKGNENEIKEIQKFSASIGALHRLDDTLSARVNGSKEPFKYRGKSAQNNMIKAVSAENGCIISNQDAETDEINLFNCGVGVSQAAITPDGKIKPCLMIEEPKFDIMRNGLIQAWQKTTGFIQSIKLGEEYKCHKCSLKPYCKWCPARGWLYKKDFSACDPESFAKAINLKNIYQGLK